MTVDLEHLRARLAPALDATALAWLDQALAAAAAAAATPARTADRTEAPRPHTANHGNTPASDDPRHGTPGTAPLVPGTAPRTASGPVLGTTSPTSAPSLTPPPRQAPIPTWELRFAEAGRRCRRGPAGANQADGVAATDATGTAATTDMAVTDATGTAATTDMAATDPADPAESTDPADTTDAVRVLLLHTARADTDTLARLYRQGTAAERRAVLLSLPHLLSGPEALSLTEDALRTNDTRLVAAAVGPYAADHLDAHTWRHAVLKCLFTGVPVDAVAALEQRARGDAELARMLRDYAAERTAAGRPVPGDLHRVLALTELSAEDTPRKES